MSIVAASVPSQTEVPEVQSNVKPESIDFGGGRYSNLMQSIYDGAQKVFRLPWQKAEKLARHCASHYGAIMAGRQVDVKVGKADKNGRITLSEASKLKGVVATPELSFMRALQYANESGLNGINYAQTSWKPVLSVQALFDKM